MTRDEFAKLLSEFTLSAETGDGARFAAHFTKDATYHDYIYGPHTGRADIAHMMQNLFHRDATDYRWEMFDPVFDGRMGYAWSLSSFTSTIPQFAAKRVVIDGMSRFVVRAGADGKGVFALDRMARAAAGDQGLSGAAQGIAREGGKLNQ
jgi:hypothetical protein